ncbi:hypothetical protein GCM10027194_21590 [Thalassiella azotivora]
MAVRGDVVRPGVGWPAAALVVPVVLGRGAPPWSAFGRYPGLPDDGAAAVVVLALLVSGFGEETGWRGFLADRLGRGHDLLGTAVRVWFPWTLWHLPLFAVSQSFGDLGPLGVAGWAVGLLAGSVVLT